MAHKKAGGSSRNGRDSAGRRLGVKKFGGQEVTARQHPGAPARDQILSGHQCRHRQGSHPVRADRRPRGVPRRQTWPQFLFGRNGDCRRIIGQPIRVAHQGGPGFDMRILQKGDGSPRLPFFMLPPLECRAPVTRNGQGTAKTGRSHDVRAYREAVVETGLGRGRPCPPKAIAREDIVRNLASAPWPYRDYHAEEFLSQPKPLRFPALLVFERTDGAPRLVGSCGIGTVRGAAMPSSATGSRADCWGRGYATEAGAGAGRRRAGAWPPPAGGRALHRQPGIGPSAGEDRLPPDRSGGQALLARAVCIGGKRDLYARPVRGRPSGLRWSNGGMTTRRPCMGGGDAECKTPVLQTATCGTTGPCR